MIMEEIRVDARRVGGEDLLASVGSSVASLASLCLCAQTSLQKESALVLLVQSLYKHVD
jgi:hypothetical protein